MACNFHAVMYKAFIHTFALSLVLVTVCARAQTQPNDNNQPTQVEADALRYDENQRLSIFTGNVQLTRGSLVLNGQRLELKEDEQGEQRGVATGQPARFERDRLGTNERVQGTAKRITYNSRNEILLLEGQAVLRRLRDGKLSDEASGERIDYTDSTGIFNVQGDKTKGDSGRVRAVIGPKPAVQGQ
jgi:lipopolysaccharide export system protein LptA